MKIRKKLQIPKKKYKREVAHNYGMGQCGYFSTATARCDYGMYQIKHGINSTIQRRPLISTRKRLVLRDTYGRLPHFRPGDTVYTVVNRGVFGTEIIKDTVEEVFSFGPKSLKNYWLKYSRASTGIDADDIYTNYNQAKFFMYY